MMINVGLLTHTFVLASCHRKKCFLYHVTGSSRPNLPKNNRDNEKLKVTNVQDHNRYMSEPTTSMNSHKQTYAEVLYQLNVMKSQIQSPDHAMAGNAMCFLRCGPQPKIRTNKQNWAHLPGQPLLAKFAHPPTLW